MVKRFAISLPPAHTLVLRELAAETGGSISAIIRDLIATSPVTKSRLTAAQERLGTT